MIAAGFAALMVLAPAQVSVGLAAWSPPLEIGFRVDTPLPTTAGASTMWAGTTSDLSSSQLRLQIDRACVTWGRVTMTNVRCRARGNAALFPLANGWNFSDGTSGIYHANSGTIASTWCNPWSGTPAASECDIYFDNTAPNAVGWTTFLNQPSGPAGGSILLNFQSQGVFWLPGSAGASSLYMYETILHEVGHALGLFHTVVPGTAIPLNCPGNTYHCPVMATGSQGRVSSWPQLDDWDSMTLKKHNMNRRRVEFGIYNISSSGTLTREVGWSSLGYYSYTPPRIACRPDGGSTSDSCIVSLGEPGGSPRFHTVDATSSTVSVSASATPAYWAEGAVDIAYGDNSQFLAIGKRPVDVGTTSTNIVTYNGTVGSTAAPLSLIRNSHFTHMEPRVSYHEPACVFVAAWPERNGQVRVTSYDLTGNQIDSQLTQVFTTVPVEISCDTHLPGTYSCQLYVQQHDGSTQDRAGNFGTYSVTVTLGSTPAYVCSADSARGDLSVLGGATGNAAWSTNTVAMLADSATYGNGRTSGQLSGAAFLVTGDRFPYNSFSNSEIIVFLDDDAIFNAASISTSYWSARNTGALGLPNTTSWDWNESARRFIVVRAGPES
jgi:hypothetical protein